MSDSLAQEPTRRCDSLSRPVAAWREPVAWTVLLLCLVLAGSEVSPRKLVEQCLVPAGFLLTIGLGGLFLVLLQHLIAARWSVRAVGYLRCNLELIPASLIFLVPIVSRFDEIWRRLACLGAAPENEASTDDLCSELAVLVRLFLCYAVWLSLAYFYARRSKPGVTAQRARVSATRLRTLSGPALVLLVFTLVLISFDRVLTLQQCWRSAVVDVYVFAGAVSAALAFLALFTLAMPRLGVRDSVADLGLRHAIARLLFGFVTFWACIGFARYLLACYAIIPAEATFFELRLGPVWRWLTTLLVALHFVLPICGLLTARARRSAETLLLVSLCVLAGHWVDWAWLVLPALYPHGAAVDAIGLVVIVVTELTVGAVVLTGLVRELQFHQTKPALVALENGAVPSPLRQRDRMSELSVQ